jgi:hypothetical protein
VQGFGIIVAVCLLCALIIFFTLSNTQYNIKKEIRLENEKQKALAARQQIRNEKLLALSIKRAQEAVTQGLVAKEESNFLPDEKDPEIAKIIQEYEEQAAETLKQEEANQSAYPTFSILIKIFASFLQFNSLAAAFNFQWPDAVMVVMNLQKKLAEIAANIISVDCAAYQSGTTFSLFYMKKIVIAFLPPIVVLIPSAFILLWAGIWKLRGLTLSTETMKITLVTSVVVVLFFILPTITKQAFGMISCVKLGINPTDYYILDAMNELCWDSQHILYVCLVCLPMIILYVVGIPVVSFRILWQNRLALQTAQLKQYFFFLYTGYENEYWFWEYTIIARKIVLVGISVFFQTNVQLQSRTLSILCLFKIM